MIDKYLELIKKDHELKAEFESLKNTHEILKIKQEDLNKEINDFLVSETGVSGPSTLLELMYSTKKKYEQHIPTIIT